MDHDRYDTQEWWMQQLKMKIVVSALASLGIAAPAGCSYAKTQEELDAEVLATCDQRHKDFEAYEAGKTPNADLKKLMDDLSECRQATMRNTKRLLDEMKSPAQP